jgi:hypothetical protein
MMDLIDPVFDFASAVTVFKGGVGEEMRRNYLPANTQKALRQPPVEKTLFDNSVGDILLFILPAFFIEYDTRFDRLRLYLPGDRDKKFVSQFFLLLGLDLQAKETATVVLRIECILFRLSVLLLCA